MSSDRTDDDVVAEYEPEEEQLEWNPRGVGKGASALVALLGLWIIAAPFVFDMVWETAFEMLEAHFWSDIVVGLTLLVLGAYNYYRRSDERVGSVGVAALVVLLGLWLIATPFVFGVGADIGVNIEALGGLDVMSLNDILVGLLVTLLGAYSAYEAQDTDVPAATET
jgi:hypothetical protein